MKYVGQETKASVYRGYLDKYKCNLILDDITRMYLICMHSYPYIESLSIFCVYDECCSLMKFRHYGQIE